MKKRLAVVLVMLVLAAAACAELFDEPSQCKTDRDCERFGPDAVCNVAQAVCFTRAPEVPEGGPDIPSDAGDDAPPARNCKAVPTPKPTENVPYDTTDGGAGDITTSRTLDCTKDWFVDRSIYVRPGATLTIHENTTIRVATGARIVITPGARIEAVGKRDEPIVFTSAQATPAASDWNGLFILGLAPPERAPDQAFNQDPLLAASGNMPDDSSGTLEFVRVEFAEEGLVFGGTGRGTKVDYVQVFRSGDNCFTFFGGTVNAKHLVCQFPTDEQFEINVGYTGKLQFLFGQKTPTGANALGRNGILTDGAGTGATIYNATILGDSVTVQGYGLVFRAGSALDVNNAIIRGWMTGLEATGNLGTPVELRGSIVSGNTTNPAFAETPDETDAAAPTFNDDNGFDEVGFFNNAGRANSTADPNLIAPFDTDAPQPWPAAAITTNARTPPATPENFFDTTAVYIGAFRDANDGWMSQWTRFGN